jgi:hypothetical protein
VLVGPWFHLRAAGAAIFVGALACSPPAPHSTLSEVDAGLCRPGALDGGAGDDGGADAGACAPADASPDHQ